MHIPDGFLSTPVWASFDAFSIPAVAYLGRRAQREFDHHKVPLMGVMGAFVFAAQMINFPVGNGTSGHLVGGALLSYALGPAAASIVMTAILTTQALVFQDGGLLALGTNVFNMAIAGVLAGYLPYVMMRGRRFGVFLGGFLSLLVSAVLALTELTVSGVPMPRPVLGISLGLFFVSALAEGGITLVVVQALDRVQPGLLRRPKPGAGYKTIAVAAIALVFAGIFIASSLPDGIQNLTHTIPGGPAHWLSEALLGLVGLAIVYAVCAIVSRILTASRPALKQEGI